MSDGIKVYCITDKYGVERFAIKKDRYSMSKLTGRWRHDPPLGRQDAAFLTEYRFDHFCDAVNYWEMNYGKNARTDAV